MEEEFSKTVLLKIAFAYMQYLLFTLSPIFYLVLTPAKKKQGPLNSKKYFVFLVEHIFTTSKNIKIYQPIRRERQVGRSGVDRESSSDA